MERVIPTERVACDQRTPLGHRAPGVFLTGISVPISSWPIQALYENASSQPADGLNPPRTRPARRRADNNNLAAGGGGWPLPLRCLLWSRERWRRRRLDSGRRWGNRPFRSIGRRATGCAASPWIRNPAPRRGGP